MSMLLNGLAGMNLNQSLGTLSFGQYGSQEMVVICDELVHMIRHVLNGIRVDDDTLALDVIREIGHGGSFLQHEHTVRYFRQQLFFPRLFRRLTIDQWVEEGSKPIDRVAHERVQAILEGAGPVQLPPGADAALERALQKALAA